eukprot:scaffold184324_cov41-Prasinocladus_malaysianus.AAC.1
MGSPNKKSRTKKAKAGAAGMGPDVCADEPEGVLYARTPKTITITMQPKTRGDHRYKLMVFTAVDE